jgi:hypothetical protein
MWSRWWSLFGGACVLTACNHQAVELAPKQPLESARWHATLASPQALNGVVQIRGSAWMGPPNSGNTKNTLVGIQIQNASPGGIHPWAVHVGDCGTDMGLFGGTGDYPPLHVGGDGTANAHTTLSKPLPSGGKYYVTVQASASNPNTTIACADLAPPTG